jgi:hypothetical protein
MERVKTLREQAKALRALASTSSAQAPHIRDQLLALAETCEQSANDQEQGLAKDPGASSDAG